MCHLSFYPCPKDKTKSTKSSLSKAQCYLLLSLLRYLAFVGSSFYRNWPSSSILQLLFAAGAPLLVRPTMTTSPWPPCTCASCVHSPQLCSCSSPFRLVYFTSRILSVVQVSLFLLPHPAFIDFSLLL